MATVAFAIGAAGRTRQQADAQKHISPTLSELEYGHPPTIRNDVKRRATKQVRRCAQVKSSDPNALVVGFVVPASPFDFTSRRLARETWVADALNLTARANHCAWRASDVPLEGPYADQRNVCAEARFFVGAVDHNTDPSMIDRFLHRGDNVTQLWEDVQLEAATNGDLVVLPHVEGAEVLALKMAMVFDWAAQHWPYADYVIKVDTDCYPYMPRLMQYLPPLKDHEPVVLGRSHPNVKWKNHPEWGSRCVGGELYGVSQSLLRLISRTDDGSQADERGTMAAWADPSGAPKWGLPLGAEYEDLFACSAIERGVGRANRTLTTILLDRPHFGSMWIHSGDLKEEEGYRKCHAANSTCYGEDDTSFSRPSSFAGDRCTDD